MSELGTDGVEGRFYDPELPFLAALERDVRLEAERVAGGPHSGRRRGDHASMRSGSELPAARTRGDSLRVPTLRVARRATTLVVLICLVGATAYGASRVFSGAHPASPLSAPRGELVEVASGHAGTERWSLRLYSLGGELCRELTVGETIGTRCEPVPRAGRAQVTSVESPSEHFVFGVTGKDVTRVIVHLGSERRSIATHSPPENARDLPGDVRFYVTAAARTLGRSEPAVRIRALATRVEPAA